MYDFISTLKVPKFYFLNPKIEDIYVEDIAHSLSMVCRFGGHCNQFYSVAEHSVIVAEILEKEGADVLTCFAGLLHDAEETYLPDIPRPIKQLLPDAAKMYEVLDSAIAQRFGLQEADWVRIKDIDHRLVITEAKALGVWNEEWEAEGAPLETWLYMWSHHDAKAEFLATFDRLRIELP